MKTTMSYGLEILGFPCDQFANQEFANIDETTQFCQLNYGVTFPIFAKIDVNGNNTNPLIYYLKNQKTRSPFKKYQMEFHKISSRP